MTKRPASLNHSGGQKPSIADTGKKPLFLTGATLPPAAGRKAENIAGDLKIYNDRDGIPVLYDKAAQAKEKSEVSRDALKVLWHDVFAPITLIKGYTATMKLGDFVTEQQKEEYLRGIEGATKRLIFVLEKLRYITGLEEMRTIAMQQTNITDLLRKICSDAQERATKHVISFRPRAVLPKININRESIETVLHNLLDNAIKYSPNGGDVDVEVLLVKTNQELNRFFPNAPKIKLPAVVVSVSDSGEGIPEEDQEKVFEKFYRVNSPLVRSVPGLGLGLYINKVNVEAHGGNIWARRQAKGGTTVSFSLPIG